MSETYQRELLVEVASDSNPSKTYRIMRGKDGVVYCTCPRWTNTRKTCKHLKRESERNPEVKAAVDAASAMNALDRLDRETK